MSLNFPLPGSEGSCSVIGSVIGRPLRGLVTRQFIITSIPEVLGASAGSSGVCDVIGVTSSTFGAGAGVDAGVPAGVTRHGVCKRILECRLMHSRGAPGAGVDVKTLVLLRPSPLPPLSPPSPSSPPCPRSPPSPSPLSPCVLPIPLLAFLSPHKSATKWRNFHNDLSIIILAEPSKPSNHRGCDTFCM